MRRGGRLCRRAGFALGVVAGLAWVAGIARAQPPATVVEYYHLDAIGSVRAVTNQAGQVIRRHDYEPFGEEWTPPPTTATLRFTGKERDLQTGLDYFGARYYRADIGRFTTVDPMLDQQAALTDPQQWNRYAYVRNNPLRYTDPDGRQIVKAATASEKQLIDAVLEARKEYANSEGLARVWAGVKLAWAESAFMPFTPTAMAPEGVAADLATRAKAIHGAVGVGTQGRTTIAVARVATSEGGELILVGSSEGALRPAQRALLQAGEQAVKGPGHAEVAVINAAQASGATVKEIAASRPICPKCNEVIRDVGAAILSLIK